LTTVRSNVLLDCTGLLRVLLVSATRATEHTTQTLLARAPTPELEEDDCRRDTAENHCGVGLVGAGACKGRDDENCDDRSRKIAKKPRRQKLGCVRVIRHWR
jgi:hypothetical protein